MHMTKFFVSSNNWWKERREAAHGPILQRCQWVADLSKWNAWAEGKKSQNRTISAPKVFGGVLGGEIMDFWMHMDRNRKLTRMGFTNLSFLAIFGSINSDIAPWELRKHAHCIANANDFKLLLNIIALHSYGKTQKRAKTGRRMYNLITHSKYRGQILCVPKQIHPTARFASFSPFYVAL